MAAEETSFEVSLSGASGAAAAVIDGSSVSRLTAPSATSTESSSAPTGGEDRSRSPGNRSRLPAMQEDVVVAYEQEDNEATQQDGGEGARQRNAFSGERRRSSRDAAGASAESLRLVRPLRDPLVHGAWMGAGVLVAPGTPREGGRGRSLPPPMPLPRAPPAPTNGEWSLLIRLSWRRRWSR